jgi:pimeloyl-[acyl-carrier protein] methyl ester esterase
MTAKRSLPTLVLLPGLDGTGSLFAPFVAALGAVVPTRIVPYPSEATDYKTCESIARAALPARGPYVLLGESFSGPIALNLAATAPPGLKGVILCASFVRNPRPGLRWLRSVMPLMPTHAAPEWLTTLLLMDRFATRDLRTLHRQILASLPAATLRERLRAVIDVDARAPLAAIRMPVLYLRALRDRLVPRRAAAELVRLAPLTQIAELEAPHFLLQCAPTGAARAARDFLRKLSTLS